MKEVAEPIKMSETGAEVFPLREAHSLVSDLMTPNPWIYWADFLFNIIVAWAAFITALTSPLFSLWQIAAYTVAVFTVYRSAIFIHELVHLKKVHLNFPIGVELHLRHTLHDSIIYL